MALNKKTQTLIPVKRLTAKKLKELKLYGRESYDEIINRLFKKEVDGK